MFTGNLDHPNVCRLVETERGETIHQTDVVILGNGPSGLAMSAVLAGWRPYYDLDAPHPNRELHQKLLKHKDTSLVDQDLSWLNSNELLMGQDLFRPFPHFYDNLVRPDADLGHNHRSVLRWAREEKVVPHVVLGQGPAGGSWSTFSAEVYTVSLSGWMDLPGYGFAQWSADRSPTKDSPNSGDNVRVPSAQVQHYFRSYPKAAEIDQHQIPFTTVTVVYREDTQTHPWHVIAYHSEEGGPLHFAAKTLCLATGAGVPRPLRVPGETSSVRILHSLQELEAADNLHSLQAPVLVVGGGISAADVVLHCLIHGVPVIHSFSGGPKDVRASLLGKLGASIYPEYHAVARLMIGKTKDEKYKAYPKSHVTEFQQGSVALLGETTQIQFSYCIICIGYEPRLDFLPSELLDQLKRHSEKLLDSKKNPVDVNPMTYRCDRVEGVYAVGPLVGDNFVRYLVGGSFAAARDIICNC